MKKNNFLLLLLLCTMATMGQSKTLTQAFVALPETYLPLLDSKSKAEIILVLNDTGQVGIRNTFGKAIQILNYDSAQQVLKLKVTDNASYEFRKMLHNQKPIFCLIRTQTLQPSASQAFFFDNNLQALPLKLKMPQATAWIKTSETPDSKIVELIQNNHFIAYSVDANHQVVFDNNLLQVLTLEQKKILEPIFIPSITLALEVSER